MFYIAAGRLLTFMMDRLQMVNVVYHCQPLDQGSMAIQLVDPGKENSNGQSCRPDTIAAGLIQIGQVPLSLGLSGTG